MNKPSIDDWPIEAQREIERLRAECAKHRIAKNEARQELARLKEIATGEWPRSGSPLGGCDPEQGCDTGNEFRATS